VGQYVATTSSQVIGTPGTLPTNWETFFTGGSGISRQVVGTGTEAGIAYADIRFFGTTTGGGVFAIQHEPLNGVSAVNGQTWTYSTYMRLSAGSIANINSFQIVITEWSSSISPLTETITSKALPTSTFARPSETRTNTSALTAFESGTLRFGFNSGVAIDITLRIGMPQMERGAFVTPVIATSGTAVTRTSSSTVSQYTPNL
jgi:hypothetical protein